MELSCQWAIQVGLPSIAFTEHADWSRGPDAVVNLVGYLECVERCRAMFPGLKILTGIELGEPHHHPDAVRDILSLSRLDRVLGSVHFIEWQGVAADASESGFLKPDSVREMFRSYLDDVKAMVESSVSFDVLAHLDYPKRYWPSSVKYDECQFEDELRAILRAAAQRGLALEINTTRGGAAARYLCPGPKVLEWWRHEGGRAVSFGTDAHSPGYIARGLDTAGDVARAAGFEPQGDPNAFWVPR
jgi:histidinol-phosphatase (PHP family)